jgi:WD40 repeat protein
MTGMKHSYFILLILLLFIASGCTQRQVAPTAPAHEPSPADEQAAKAPSLPTFTPPAPEPTPKPSETPNPAPPPPDTTQQRQLALAAKLGLPEGYRAEVLLEPELLSPLFIAATSDDKLLVAEHYGSRLLRINPLTAKIDVLYNLPHGEWHALLSDGAAVAYLSIKGKIVHINENGTYSLYSDYNIHPAALGPNGEIYGYTKSDVLVLQSKDEEPKVIATGFSNIFDLVRDKEGNLYVSDWDLGTVTKIKLDGTTQLLAYVNQKDPIDLGFAPDGTMYVNEGTVGLSQIDKNNGTLKKIDWFGGYTDMHPTDFVFLSNGKAYFVDPTHNNLIRADFMSKKMDIVIVGRGNSRALDVGPDGAVYIGDNNGYPFYRSRILRIQLNGSVEIYADNLDAISDLSFSQNGNMFIATNYVEKEKYNINSVLLITPEREVKTLVSWDSRSSPEMRDLWSISVNPKTGMAIAYDKISNKLISIDENGKVSVLPNSFDFDEMQAVYLDHAADGTLYAIEVNREGFGFGPIIERNIIQFDENGSPKIITEFNHIGSGTCENLALAPDGTLYVVGIKGNIMSLGKITNDGKEILLSDKLPIDPLAVAVDAQGNIYICCAAGLFRIYPA